jgi:SnoaL-like domain
MSDVHATIDAYLEGLTQTDAARRAELIRTAWADDGRFVDPLFDVQGHAALDELAQGVIAQYPGHTFRRTSGVDAHHNLARYTFEFVAPDGAIVITGTDVGELGDDGRLRAITGFFGDVPADEAA